MSCLSAYDGPDIRWRNPEDSPINALCSLKRPILISRTLACILCSLVRNSDIIGPSNQYGRRQTMLNNSQCFSNIMKSSPTCAQNQKHQKVPSLAIGWMATQYPQTESLTWHWQRFRKPKKSKSNWNFEFIFFLFSSSCCYQYCFHEALQALY